LNAVKAVDVEIQGMGGPMPTVWPISDRARAWLPEVIEVPRGKIVQLAVGVNPEDVATVIASAHDAGLEVEVFRIGREEGRT